MARVLVVGASSRLGGFLRRAWAQNLPGFAPVWQFRSPHPGRLYWDPAEGHHALMREVASNGPISAMIMLAGAVPGRGAATSNAMLSETALSAAAAAGIPRVLLASSAAVYGPGNGRPARECDPCEPLSDYGRDKLAAEAAGQRWHERGLEVCAMRIGNVIGADALLAYEKRREPRTIDVFADGRGPVRSWLGPGDWARAAACLAGFSGPLPKAVNLASDPPIAMDELADAARIPWQPRRAVSPQQTITLDCSILRELTDDDWTVSCEALIEQWRAFGDTG